MIRKMVFKLKFQLIAKIKSILLLQFDDLKDFLIIIGTFVVAFGIALQSILYQDVILTSNILIEILNIAYWPIYGEINVLDIINEDKCSAKNSNELTCTDSMTHLSSYILLMIYMVMANVLLLSLLIAMFR